MGKDLDKNDSTDDDKGGEGGEGGESGKGGKGGSAGTGTWVPNYYELLGISPDEKELAGLADQALFEQRISVKSKGIEVTALSKIQKLRNQLQDPTLGNSPGGGGLELEAHPELPEQGGEVDPNTIVLPESEALERAANDPKLQLQLRNRLAAKFGMSQDISLQSMKEEYRKKMEMRSRPKPDEPKPGPRYRPSNAPRPRPL